MSPTTQAIRDRGTARRDVLTDTGYEQGRGRRGVLKYHRSKREPSRGFIGLRWQRDQSQRPSSIAARLFWLLLSRFGMALLSERPSTPPQLTGRLL